MTCDIVIPVYDQVDYTRGCVESIFANTSGPFRLIIVNDGSREKATADYLRELQAREPARVLVLHNERNQGYLETVNRGLKETSAEFVVVMNNDTLVYPDWLSEMIAVAEQEPSIGIVNPQWEVSKRFDGHRDQYFMKGVLPQKGKYIETDWARGFCYLMKRCVIDKIGGLDRDFSPAYYDDWDYSLRAMAAGYRCVRALGAFVYHYQNITYAECGEQDHVDALLKAKRVIFYKRWGRPLAILMVDDGTPRDLSVIITRLLRDQNKIVLISDRPVELKHTNLKVVKVPRRLAGPTALLMLIENARHCEDKKYHLVLGGENALSFLKRTLLLPWKRPLAPLSSQADVSLGNLIRKMKFQGQTE